MKKIKVGLYGINGHQIQIISLCSPKRSEQAEDEELHPLRILIHARKRE